MRTTKSGQGFDEAKHPRDHGKFSHTEGASGPATSDRHPLARSPVDSESFVAQQAAEARAHALAGHPGSHWVPARAPATPEEAEHAASQAADNARRSLAEDTATEADLHAAHVAGHLDDGKIADAAAEYEAADKQAAADAHGVAADLDKAQGEAASKLHAFEAVDSGIATATGNDHGEDFEDFHAALNESALGFIPEHEGYDDNSEALSLEPPDEPIRSDFEDESDYKDAKDEFEADKAKFDDRLAEAHKAHAARASAAQDALEALHAQQVAAKSKLDEVTKPALKARAKASRLLDKTESDDLIKASAFPGDEAKNEDSGEFTDPKVQSDYERASRAAEELHGRYREKIEQSTSPVNDESMDALKAATSETAAAIKRLAKITGRPPKLASRPKKSANRPDPDAAATVVSMARYKLRLSKLDWISPVDVPAQETANVLLIKRHGPVKAFARVTKIDDGLGLVFCWAFTSKVAGVDYHDLQGDAIDEDFVKAAADFMLNGGGTDEMHDGKGSGRVVFAMPMTPEIAKAYGVTATTTGLMVALKPPPAVLAKFKSGEYTGVSIAGLGTREVAKARRGGKKPRRMARTYKSVVLTSEVDGHAHTIDLCAPESCWSGSLSTSYQNAEGADSGHSHAWVYEPDTGVITIAADSGHTHTIAAVVPDEVRAAAAAKDDDDDQGSPVCTDEDDKGDSDGGTKVVVVNARAPAADSTPAGAVPTVKTQEQDMATDQEKIAELEKRSARFEKMSTLTDAARAHFAKLGGGDADAFLAKSAAERDLVLAEIAKADEVVWESPIDGSKYRKSDDVRLINTAKALAESVAKQRAAEAAEREAVFSKRGDEVLKNFPSGAKKNLRGRIMKALNAEFADPAEYEEAVKAIKGMDSAFGELTVAKGYKPESDATDQSPTAQLQQLVKRHATEHKVSEAAAYAAVLDTTEGARLYAQQPVGRA